MSFDPTGFSISTTEHDGSSVVVIRGELDLATAPALEKAIGDRLDAGDAVIVDLRELQFMDSTGLRVLVRAHARAGEQGRFSIVRPLPGGPIAKILAIAGVEDQLDVIDDV